MSTPESRPPVMERYARHVLVCTGGFCSAERRGRAIYSRLAQLLQREDLLFGPRELRFEIFDFGHSLPLSQAVRERQAKW